MNYNNYSYYNQQNLQPQVGFMSVRGKDMVVNYPIAPGNTIIFKDETAPYVYIKSMGYSTLESPKLEIYKREDPIVQQQSSQNTVIDNSINEKLQSDIDSLYDEIEDIKKKLNSNTASTTTTNNRTRKKGAENDTE